MIKLFLENVINKLYIFFFKREIKINIFSRVDFSIIKNIEKKIEEHIIIHSSVLRGKIFMNSGVKIIGNVSISGNVEIGKFTSISGPSTRISGKKFGVKIGNFCSIASNVIIQEDGHDFNKITSYFINSNLIKNGEDNLLSKGKIEIKDDVWVGSNSVILSGVKIGRGCIIGAGSVVTKDVEAYSIVGGNPAKVLKKRFTDEEILKLENLRWWEWNKELIIKNRELFREDVKEIKI